MSLNISEVFLRVNSGGRMLAERSFAWSCINLFVNATSAGLASTNCKNSYVNTNYRELHTK